MLMTAFLVIALCSLVEVEKLCRGALLLHRNLLTTRGSENSLVRLQSGPKGAGFKLSELYV
jgi:hypothetical protein